MRDEAHQRENGSRPRARTRDRQDATLESRRCAHSHAFRFAAAATSAPRLTNVFTQRAKTPWARPAGATIEARQQVRKRAAKLSGGKDTSWWPLAA